MSLYEKVEAKDRAIYLALIIDRAQFYAQYGRKYSDVIKETKSGVSDETGEPLSRRQLVKNLSQLLQQNHKLAAEDWFFKRVNELPEHQKDTVRRYYAKPFKLHKRTKTRLRQYLTDNWSQLKQYSDSEIFNKLIEKGIVDELMEDYDNLRRYWNRLGFRKRI